ncbi:MAG TPA: hypothetical protein VGS08_02285 [Candidatus Saccharimonadales bacterium]|nr:hypothetical protein [Candidatus Saccharimonadales bacterium]
MARTPRQPPTKDKKLAEQARLLLASPYFVGTQDGALLAEKQPIFLVLAGLKPLAEASSGHRETTANGRHTAFDDPAAVGSFLRSLGLHYRLRHDEHATDALVALQPGLLDKYEQAAADDVTTTGELFGYPKTAVTAMGTYVQTGNETVLLPVQEQDDIERKAGLRDTYFVNFRFSRDHWKDELAICQHWYEVLRTYGLA